MSSKHVVKDVVMNWGVLRLLGFWWNGLVWLVVC